MKLYIIFDSKENRPVVARENFGNLLVYPSMEQAMARLKDDNYYIKEISAEWVIREFDVVI